MSEMERFVWYINNIEDLMNAYVDAPTIEEEIEYFATQIKSFYNVDISEEGKDFLNTIISDYTALTEDKISNFRNSSFFETLINQVFDKMTDDRKIEFLDGARNLRNGDLQFQIFKSVQDDEAKKSFIKGNIYNRAAWFLNSGVGKNTNIQGNAFMEVATQDMYSLNNVISILERNDEKIELTESEMAEYVSVITEKIDMSNMYFERELEEKAKLYAVIGAKSKTEYLAANIHDLDEKWSNLDWSQQEYLGRKFRTNIIIVFKR